MGKILAIQGDKKRGEDVINALNMLNKARQSPIKFSCTDQYKCYYLDNKGNFAFFPYEEYYISKSSESFTIVTIDEFESRYPYKVGDMVIFHGARAQIVSMKWEEETNDVVYTVVLDGERWQTFTKYLRPFKGKKVTPRSYEEVSKYLLENSVRNAQNLLDIERCLEGDGLKLPDNININSGGIGSAEFIGWYENPPYPKSYEECCKVLGFEHDGDIVYSGKWLCGNDYLEKQLKEIRQINKLFTCLNAYRKLAGEQLGLDDSWEPSEHEIAYNIRYLSGEIITGDEYGKHYVLEFPTKQLRDVFLENFKELIENCNGIVVL